MFRHARRIAVITVLTAAAATLPAASASATVGGPSTIGLSAQAPEPIALLLPAVQSAREAARR